MKMRIFSVRMLLLPTLSAGFATVYSAIPQLTNLTLTPPSRYPPQLGGRNMTHCCLLAVNSTFTVENGNLSVVDPSFLAPGTTPASFLSSINTGQFPCGASYSGNPSGAPRVQSTYRWCKSNCNGWQISQANKLQQWIGPLVSFILPALIFCLNVPKRRAIELGDRLFRFQPGKWWTMQLALARFMIAAVMAGVDTLIWLVLCFVFAAPMILSGVYEAFWDHRILNFLDKEGASLPLQARARLLYIILVGNIELGGDGGAWDDVEFLIDDQNLREEKGISRTRTRLLSILRTQINFATAVGAPIVFFAGGLAYTIADTKSSLGDNDVAHALAFGMWWMIIPHTAIISSLLLASNNPSTFEAIVGRPISSHPPAFKIFALAYPSRYKTEWMWFRGRSKYLWIKKALHLHHIENGLPDIDLSVKLSIFDWAMVTAFALILIAVPLVLAFLISYFTPVIGLSCRSLTFAVYFLTQMLQLALWVWVLKSSTICSKGNLHSPMRWTQNTRWNAYRCWIWWTLAAVFGAASVLTSIGSTIMQLLGVYRNCLCSLPIQYWRDPGNADTYISLGTNTADEIMAAKTWWIGTGVIAITFLCMNCYWGWWYSGRVRGIYQNVLDKCLVD